MSTIGSLKNPNVAEFTWSIEGTYSISLLALILRVGHVCLKVNKVNSSIVGLLANQTTFQAGLLASKSRYGVSKLVCKQVIKLKLSASWFLGK